MTVHYDDLDINRDIRFDIPLREGVGTITQDVAKLHHPVALINTPSWTILDSHLTCLTLNGTNEYLQSLNADTVDLEPTSGDYSIGGWFFVASGGDSSEILIGRYEVDVGGWELYHYSTGLVTLRHHHAGGAALRTAVYSPGWGYNQWYFIGVSRSGVSAPHYQGTPGSDLTALTMVGALEDPEATTRDLVIGARFTKNGDFHKGMFWRWRYWGDRALTQADWARIYEKEVRWFLS